MTGSLDGKATKFTNELRVVFREQQPATQLQQQQQSMQGTQKLSCQCSPPLAYEPTAVSTVLNSSHSR
jgi:hypothetical protein